MSRTGLGTMAIALAVVATLAPACSSGSTGPAVAHASSGSTASPAGKTGALAFARCMRSHRVSNFPDPGGSLPAGIDTLSPAYRAAEQACQALLPQGSGGGPSAAEQEAGLQYAACMRSHGAPGFPDPIVGHGFQFNLPPGMDPNSPPFRTAQAACASWTPDHGRGQHGPRPRESP